jgi:long-chain acyl-CoA synthetase
VLAAYDAAGHARTLTDHHRRVASRRDHPSKPTVPTPGYNVYPREVEEVLHRHPAVASVPVIGVPDAKYGEEVCAVVRAACRRSGAAGGGRNARADLAGWTRQHLAAYKYPRRFEFDDTLSLASGNVLKRELVDRYWSLASE